MIVIGTGGHARVISDILFLTNIKLAAYYDDRNIKTFLSKNVFSPVKTISVRQLLQWSNRIRKFPWHTPI